MKKILLLFAICCFAACDNINKEELKEEIVAELKSASTHLSVVKGSGANFYAEPAFLGSSGTYINEVYIQHSNLNCPVIHNGVQRNCYKIDPYHNTFCSACMSDDLITEWNFGICFLVFYLIIKSADWSESSNSIKQNTGCTVMALVFVLGFLLTILGAFKSCSNNDGPSYDYYDAPRK